MRKSRAECALGEEIEAGMDAAGYTTVRDLARDAGVSEASIGRWIRGRQTPEPQALARVAQALGVDYDRLAAVTWPETQPASNQLTEAERLIINSDLPDTEKQQL